MSFGSHFKISATSFAPKIEFSVIIDGGFHHSRRFALLGRVFNWGSSLESLLQLKRCWWGSTGIWGRGDTQANKTHTNTRTHTYMHTHTAHANPLPRPGTSAPAWSATPQPAGRTGRPYHSTGAAQPHPWRPRPGHCERWGEGKGRKKICLHP